MVVGANNVSLYCTAEVIVNSNLIQMYRDNNFAGDNIDATN